MTTSETVHIYSLIALRALAEYDPYEFKRATDLSRRQIDETIERLFSEIRYSGVDERRVSDITQKLDDLRGLDTTSESPATLAYLLRQVGNSSLERAYQLALNMDRTGELRKEPMHRSVGRQGKPGIARAAKSEHEFLRLGVMRLLRDLPNYEPRFDYRFRNLEVDCFLEATVEGYPPILIEAKASLATRAAFQRGVQQLAKISAGWGRGVVTALLSPNIPEEIRANFHRENRKVFLLEYDPETNEFDLQDYEAFVSAVELKRTPS